MYKIPNENKIFSQTNQSDLLGNIWYTKNINFDEEGYAKLSSRSISLISEKDDSDFDLPVGLGRYTEGGFVLATTDNPYILDASNTSLSIAKDTDSDDDAPPDMTFNTYGKWWNNKWHITTNTKLYYKTISNGNWTDTGTTALTSTVPHPLCRFEKQGTGSLLIGNGNKIVQIDSSYATGTLAQLEISSDYEIIGIAYNNNQVGIITRLASTIEGQNQEAGFFTWDGSESSANQMFSVGSDAIVSITPYKSSFVITTRTGQRLYFNGGGFEDLTHYPIYYKDYIWGDFLNRNSYGDSMIVDGGIVYENIGRDVSNSKGEPLESMPAGVWAYDNKVGTYHKYSGSISNANMISVLEAGVNLTSNTLTRQSGTIYETGNPIKATSSGITEIKDGTIYYIIKVSSTEFKLAETYEDAIALNPIDLTAVSGSSYFIALNLKDYGQSYAGRTAGIGLMGAKSLVYDDLIFGGDYYNTNGTAYAGLCLTIDGFKNIGYFTTPKMTSSQVEDNITKLFIKYRPLKDGDKIVVKYKNREYPTLPEYADLTAVSTTVFTTTDDISDSYNFTDELECEILSGSGAGQMRKISSITYSTGTYTITLNEALDGVTSSDVLKVKIDNWKVLDTIDNTHPNDWKELGLAETSKWIKCKVVLEGTEVSVEELQIINNNHLPSK